MPNLGGPEIIIVLVVVVLLFGAKKLPELGSSVGKSITNFKAGMKEAKEDDPEAPDAGMSSTNGSEAATPRADKTSSDTG